MKHENQYGWGGEELGYRLSDVNWCHKLKVLFISTWKKQNKKKTRQAFQALTEACAVLCDHHSKFGYLVSTFTNDWDVQKGGTLIEKG